MIFKCVLIAAGLFAFSTDFCAQPPTPAPTPIRLATDEAVENISKNMDRLTQSVENLNRGLKSFFQSFTSSQGFRLSPKQQTLLMAFEVLNRAEQRLVNLQKMRLDIAERQSPIRLQLARIIDDLLPQSVDRYVSTRGTTNAEELKDIRRNALNREKTEISRLLNAMENDMQKIENEVTYTQAFIKNIRERIFPELEKELTEL
jgi:polyhydroxyalkanoate synthesis regulator phasin